MTSTRELLAAKAAAKAKAEGILNSVQASARKMSDAENTEFDALTAEVVRIEDLLSKQAIVAGWQNPSVRPSVTGRRTPVEIAATAEYSEAFYAMVRRGQQAAPEFLASLSEISGPAGAYLVPTTLDAAIIKKAASQSAMRQLAKVITTSNDRNIVIEDGVADAAWTNAGSNGGTLHETTPTFSRVTLTAYKASALAKVDNELLNDSAFNVEAELADQFGRAFGLLTEDKYVNGTGANEPYGIARAAAVNVHTASPSAITGDELITLFHSLKPAYRSTATFLLNDSTALVIRKLKNTTTGDYLWQPGLASGSPDRLLGRPVAFSDAMPTCGASNVSVIFGDFQQAFVIADRVPRSFQRLVELYANSDQTGFKSTFRTDSRMVNFEAASAMRQSS
jgi:HK97 family phage major capsid protein